MTDKEMAEQFADNISGLELTCSLLSAKDKSHAYRLGRYDGFLAGLKEGRPKWHKVADGDLPKHCRYGTRTSEHVLVKFKSGNTGVCYFDFDLLGWFANGYPEQLKNIIAWCEIPKYTEE